MIQFINEKKKEWAAEKDVFVSALLIGALAHMFMLTNKIPNIDDYISMFHYGSGYPSGRWLLALMGNFMYRIDGTYSTPFLNGVFFVVALSLAITIFLKPFHFENKWAKRIMAGVFMAFPTATATLSYMFAAPFYGTAILLAAVAFYALVNYKYGFALSIVTICCSLGIYQAYWCLVAGFMLLYLLYISVKEEYSVKDICEKAIKSFVALLLGVVLYLLVNKAMLAIQGIQLLDYQGLSDMGKFEVSRIPHIIAEAYSKFVFLLTDNYMYITSYPFVRLVIGLGYLISVVFVLFILMDRKKGLFKRLAMLFFVGIFPLTVNSIYIMCADATSVHTLMCYSVVLVFYLPFVLIEGANALEKKKIFATVSGAAYACLLALALLLYVRFANIFYLNLELSFYEGFAYMNTLSTRIQSVEEYSPDKPIYFYGSSNHSPNRNLWEMRMVNQVPGAVDVEDIINSPMMRQMYSRVYLGNAFYELSDVTKIEPIQSDIAQMPVYPSDGSILVLEDIIVVKLSETE